ncbi:hypothetical protein PQX77_014819 [Marasmius sp. AFHP31]|nr:hypothetical protein PQX77_014819 [Marasmius sp. AFHP31]
MRSFSILLLLATTLVSPAVAAPVADAVSDHERRGGPTWVFVDAMGNEQSDDTFQSIEKRGSTESFVHAMGPIITYREDEKRDSDGASSSSQ